MVTVPTYEMGYQVDGQGFWGHLELEETPELIFPLSVQVFDRMRRQDAQVGSVLRAVTLPVRRTQWHIDPNGADPRVVKHVADDLNLPIVGQPLERRNRSRGRFSWAQHLQLALLMLPHGFSYFEQEYQIDDATPGGTHLKALNWRPARSIQKAEVGRDGSLVSIRQWGIEKEIPVDRLVAYVNDREGGNWYGQSLLRPAYKNWLIKDDLLRTDAQTIRRNGMGVPLYKGFPNEGEKDPGLTKGLEMAQSWRSGELAGGAIDHEADMQLLGVSGTLPQALPSIRYHDEQIARAVLAHFLNLGTQTGSWALGSTFADFFTLSLQTVGEAVADIANQHIVEDIVDINYGEDEPAPLITFEEIGSRQMLTAQALKLLIDAGAFSMDENLEDALRQQYGMPPRDPNAPKNQPPQPQPPVPGQHDPVPVPDPTGGQ